MEERKNLALFGVVFLVSLASLVYLVIKIGKIGVGSFRTYYAVFENTKGLAEKADVRLGGVKVGFVESMKIKIDGRNLHVEVKMRIKPEIPVRKDFEAQIRMKSLLGEKYIELVPTGEGDTSEAEEGFTITRTKTIFEADELLVSLRPIIESLNPEILSELSKIAPELIESVKPIVNNTSELIEKINRILPTLEYASKNLPELTENIRKVLEIASSNSEAIQKSIVLLPDTLEMANKTLTSVKNSLEEINSLIGKTMIYQDNISKVIEISPTLIEQSLYLVRFLNSMVPEFQKVLTQTSTALEELQKTLRSGVKVRIF